MPRKPFVTDEWIIELYMSTMPMDEISKRTGLTPRAIRNIMLKHGVERRKVGQPRKHPVNEHFFKTWTHEMAWVLGLFVTDGHLSKTTCTIHFAQKDERILKIIAAYMEAPYILAPTGPTRSTPILLINSQTLKRDLELFGITSNKSLTLTMPPVPEHFLPSFIRGVIDGDGHIDKDGYSMFITTASIQFAEGLLTVFKSWQLTSHIKKIAIQKGKCIYRVYVTGKHMIIKLAHIIYANVDEVNENFHVYKRVYFTQHCETPYKHKTIEVQHTKSIKASIERKKAESLKQAATLLNQPMNRLIEPYITKAIIDLTQYEQVPIDHYNDKAVLRLRISGSLYTALNKFTKTSNVKRSTIIEHAIAEFIRENTSCT